MAAVARDAPPLSAEEAAYFSSRYEDAVREPDSTWQDWAQASEGVEKVLFVAEDDEGWAASSERSAATTRAEVQLISMWVDPRARGRGVGQALIREVAAWARDLGSRRVVLFVQEVNAGGQALYRRRASSPTGDRMPVGVGRRGFKLVFAASVDEPLPPDPCRASSVRTRGNRLQAPPRRRRRDWLRRRRPRASLRLLGVDVAGVVGSSPGARRERRSRPSTSPSRRCSPTTRSTSST